MWRLSPVLSRLSYANVVSTLALFAALGGASYAAVAIPANSVGPRQLTFPLGITARGGRATSLFATNYGPLVFRTLITTDVVLKRPAKLLVLASATISDPPPAGGSGPSSVGFFLRAVLDANQIGIRDYPVSDNPSTATFAQVVTASAGRHIIRLTANAAGAGQSVHVNDPQLAVVVLPGLG